MAVTDTTGGGRLERDDAGGVSRIAAHGAWTIETVATLEAQALQGTSNVGDAVVLDLTDVGEIDTSGAWLINHIAEGLRAKGAAVELVGASEATHRLLAAVEPARAIPPEGRKRLITPIQLLEVLGKSTANGGADLMQALSILGAILAVIARAVIRPARFRFTSIVFHLDRTGLQAVPIIALMAFLIGGIIAQQGVFQLSFFGAQDFAVDLVGILMLREIGVLLAAIMLAGRSGSAYTAEIGSMKMREELDALKVIGLDPIEVLIMPRVVALVIALPLLSFISDLSGLVGGAVVAFAYGNMDFQRFILLLRSAIDMSTLMVGLIKAPFMGLIIGLIAATEGLNVEGSAESLGRRTTSSVVKAIFTVIVADGLFSIFFAAINY